jgi:hypothetical protein
MFLIYKYILFIIILVFQYLKWITSSKSTTFALLESTAFPAAIRLEAAAICMEDCRGKNETF